MNEPAKLLDWRPLAKNTLLGFAKVQFGSGIIISEISVHRAGTGIWASPPSRPWTKGNQLLLDDTGRPKWQQLIEFSTPGVRSSWSQQVLAALRQAHPEIFALEPA
jgi:hypothetical protein